MFGVPSTLHLNLRGGSFDPVQIVWRKVNGSCTEILVQPFQLSCSRGSARSTASARVAKRVRSGQVLHFSAARCLQADRPLPDSLFVPRLTAGSHRFRPGLESSGLLATGL